MTAIYEHRLRVQDDEIDGLKHANNLVYLQWMQDAAIAHSNAVGWTAQRYRESRAGWVVRSHQIEYYRPALAGDEIIVRTWVVDMKPFTSLRRFHILRAADEAKLATAATNWAFINYETGRLARVPEIVSSAFILLPDEKMTSQPARRSS